jgi:hypothetical protein
MKRVVQEQGRPHAAEEDTERESQATEQEAAQEEEEKEGPSKKVAKEGPQKTETKEEEEEASTQEGKRATVKKVDESLPTASIAGASAPGAVPLTAPVNPGAEAFFGFRRIGKMCVLPKVCSVDRCPISPKCDLPMELQPMQHAGMDVGMVCTERYHRFYRRFPICSYRGPSTALVLERYYIKNFFRE